MSVNIVYHHCLLFLSCIASVQCDLSAIEFITKYVFQSCLPVAALPQHTRDLLLTSHCLDSSLPPIAAQKILLQHIFQAQCFLKTSSSTCHCGIFPDGHAEVFFCNRIGTAEKDWITLSSLLNNAFL